jgi:hypothetical protein
MPRKPAGLTIIAASLIIGPSVPALYVRIRDGSVPVLPLRGDMRVSVVGAEAIIGRSLTIEEIESTELRAT